MRLLSSLIAILLMWTPASAALADNHASAKKNILFLVECSAHMHSALQHNLPSSSPEESRFQASLKLIDQILQTAPSNYSIGLRTFGTGTDCDSTELKVPLSKNRHDIKKGLMDLSLSKSPKQQTLNAMVAVKTAIESDLASHQQENHIVLLSSDEDEFCKYDPQAYPKLLKDHADDHLWIISVALPNNGYADAQFLQHQAALAKDLGCRNYSIADQSKFLQEFTMIFGRAE